MPEPLAVLATPHEIRTILGRALEALRRASRFQGIDTADLADAAETNRERESLRLRGILEALRFCAYAAALLQDTALLPVIHEAIRAKKDVHLPALSDREALGEALSALLRAGPVLDGHVERLARDVDPGVRTSVATGLSPWGNRIALLDALAADPIPEVHFAAKAALAPLRGPWWKGRFSSDPLPRLSDDEAALHKPTLERLDLLLDRTEDGRAPRAPLDEIVEQAASLPAPLAVELLETLLSGEASTALLGHPTMLARLIQLPGGVDAMVRLCQAWAKQPGVEAVADAAAAAIPLLEGAQRVALAEALMAFALSRSPRQRCRPDDPGALAAGLSAYAWPDGHDLTPVLDGILSLPPSDDGPEDQVVALLGLAFAAPGTDVSPILDRVIAARAQGYPRRWRVLGEHLDRLLERVPPARLRASIQKAADAQSVPDVPASEDIDQEIAGDEYLCLRLLPHLRQALRAGRLGLKEAWHTMRTIDDLHGGLASAEPADDIEGRREALRQEVGEHLGPKAMQGPPTTDEWQAYRAARARYPSDGARRAWYALTVLPPGAWSAEDREELDRALMRLRCGDIDLWRPLASALAAKPLMMDLPLFDDLSARVGSEDQAHLRELQAKALGALGLPQDEPTRRVRFAFRTSAPREEE
jgi:hypothetical protein